MNTKEVFIKSITELEKSGVSAEEAEELLASQYDSIELNRGSLETAVFVVTRAGDAPVSDRGIVTASAHAELLEQYAASGYAAEPANISNNNLDSVVASAQATADYKGVTGK